MHRMLASLLVLVALSGPARAAGPSKKDRATAAFRAKRFAVACPLFAEVVTEQPDDAWGWNDLALCRVRLGELEQAVVALQRAAGLAAERSDDALTRAITTNGRLVAKALLAKTTPDARDLRLSLETSRLFLADEQALECQLVERVKGAAEASLEGDDWLTVPTRGLRSRAPVVGDEALSSGPDPVSADYLHQLRTFVAIAESGSLAGGARRRGLSAPAATRSLAALEATLGTRLIVRTTRTLRVTEVGQRFLTDTRRNLAALEAAEATVRGQRDTPEGLLSVTAPELFGQRHVAPLLFELMEQHPQVRVQAFFSNRVVHLIDEGFDVAVRIGRLPDSSLTALPVGAMRSVLVASPRYLQRHGAPKSLDALSAHQTIGFTIDGLGKVGLRPGRRETNVELERFTVNTNAVKVAAAVAGHGITRALAYQVVDEVRAGRLRVVLERFEHKPVPVHLLYPEGRSASAKVRVFLELATQRLRRLPFFQPGGLATELKRRA